VRCPTCKSPVDPASRFRPFCSERCKLLDLGRWLDGSYTIPGEDVPDDDAGDDADDDAPPPRRN